jgi:hypothetical protein
MSEVKEWNEWGKDETLKVEHEFNVQYNCDYLDYRYILVNITTEWNEWTFRLPRVKRSIYLILIYYLIKNMLYNGVERVMP